MGLERTTSPITDVRVRKLPPWPASTLRTPRMYLTMALPPLADSAAAGRLVVHLAGPEASEVNTTRLEGACGVNGGCVAWPLASVPICGHCPPVSTQLADQFAAEAIASVEPTLGACTITIGKATTSPHQPC